MCYWKRADCLRVEARGRRGICLIFEVVLRDKHKKTLVSKLYSNIGHCNTFFLNLQKARALANNRHPPVFIIIIRHFGPRWATSLASCKHSHVLVLSVWLLLLTSLSVAGKMWSDSLIWVFSPGNVPPVSTWNIEPGWWVSSLTFCGAYVFILCALGLNKPQKHFFPFYSTLLLHSESPTALSVKHGTPRRMHGKWPLRK